MTMLKIFTIFLSLTFSTIIFASKNDALSNALAAEFYLQNNEPDEAYLAYQKIIAHQPNKDLAERALDIANLTNNKDWQQQSMSRLLKFKPNDVRLAANYLLSFFNVKQSKLAKIKLNIFFKFLKKNTKNQHELYATLAVVLARAKNKEISTKLIKNYLISTSVPSLNGIALYFYLLNKNKISVKYLKQSLKIKPYLDKTLVLFANVLYTKGEKQKAINLLEHKLIIKQSILLNTSLVTMLMREKLYKKSVAIYLKLIQKDVENINKWRKILSSVYLILGKIDESKILLTILLKEKGYKNYANYSLGLLYEESESYEKAKIFYKKVTNGNYYLKAKTRLIKLIAINDKATALEIIDTIEVNQLNDYIDLLMLKISIYELHKEWQKSYAIYSAIIDLQPNNNDLYYSRALLSDKMNRIDLTEQDLRLVIENDAEHYDALNALGYALTVHTKRYSEAKQYIKRALQLQPKSFYILDSMGWVLYKLGKKKQAVIFLKKAFKIKADAEIAVHLALVLQSLGNKNESNKYLLQAISLDKNNPVVMKALKEINNK